MLQAIWRRSWEKRMGGRCSATSEESGIRNCGATVRKRSMRPRGFGGALSISSWSISAAILSIAVQCQPSLETWVPAAALPFVPHLLGRFTLPQPHMTVCRGRVIGHPGETGDVGNVLSSTNKHGT